MHKVGLVQNHAVEDVFDTHVFVPCLDWQGTYFQGVDQIVVGCFYNIAANGTVRITQATKAGAGILWWIWAQINDASITA